jgi:hypothetical protein
MRWRCSTAAFFFAWLAAGVDAQVCREDQIWESEPQARDTYAMRFVGRTVASAAVEIKCAVGGCPITDSNPAAMRVAGPTASGDLVSFVLYPDAGCGTAGCRAGNRYQIRVQATDADTNTPTGNVCFIARRQVLKVPGGH